MTVRPFRIRGVLMRKAQKTQKKFCDECNNMVPESGIGLHIDGIYGLGELNVCNSCMDGMPYEKKCGKK